MLNQKVSETFWIKKCQNILSGISFGVCVCVCVCVRARVFGLPIVEKIIPEIAEGERNELEKAERIQVVHKWVRGRRRMG
jgi:hypothetical protein